MASGHGIIVNKVSSMGPASRVEWRDGLKPPLLQECLVLLVQWIMGMLNERKLIVWGGCSVFKQSTCHGVLGDSEEKFDFKHASDTAFPRPIGGQEVFGRRAFYI
jgi:hypothetical protein